jgi:alcohol dehydrogenase class IV
MLCYGIRGFRQQAAEGRHSFQYSSWIVCLRRHSEVEFEDLALRFMDIRKRIYKFPTMGTKAIMIAIPTTSGTGSEVTLFVVVTGDATGKKYPIADYELIPNMAIIDPNLMMSLPKSLTAFSGIDAVVHAWSRMFPSWPMSLVMARQCRL